MDREVDIPLTLEEEHGIFFFRRRRYIGYLLYGGGGILNICFIAGKSLVVCHTLEKYWTIPSHCGTTKLLVDFRWTLECYQGRKNIVLPSCTGRVSDFFIALVKEHRFTSHDGTGVFDLRCTGGGFKTSFSH